MLLSNIISNPNSSFQELWHTTLSPWFYENREIIKKISDILSWISVGLSIFSAAAAITGIGIGVALITATISYVLGLISGFLDFATSLSAIDHGSAEPGDYFSIAAFALCLIPGGTAPRNALKAATKKIVEEYSDDIAKASVKTLGKESLESVVRQRKQDVAELIKAAGLSGDEAIAAEKYFDKLLASGISAEKIEKFIENNMTRAERLEFIDEIIKKCKADNFHNIDELGKYGTKTPDIGLGKAFMEVKTMEKGVPIKFKNIEKKLDEASKQLLPDKAGIGNVNGRIVRMPERNDIQRIIAIDTTNRELKEGASWSEIFAEIQNWMKKEKNLHVTEVVVKVNDNGVEKLYSITRTSIYPPIGG